MGYPIPTVKAMFQDRDHQFWFATWGGVGLYDAHSISIFDLSAEISKAKGVSEISQIVQDQRKVIYGSGLYLTHFTYLSKSVFRLEGEAL